MYEGIYLLQEREFVNSGKNVYKLGRSYTLNNRIKQYPKNSKLILIILCKKSTEIEKVLLKLLTKKFKLCYEYGSEYFKGKLDKIIHEIENIFKNIKCLFCRINNSTTNTFNFKCLLNDNSDSINKIIFPIQKKESEYESLEDSGEDSGEDSEDSEDSGEDSEDSGEDSGEGIDKNVNSVNINININHDKKINNITQNIYDYVNNFKNNNTIIHKCKKCMYSTNKMCDYNKHLLTNKHKNNILLNPLNNNLIDKIDKISVNQKNLAKQNEELKKKIELLEKSNQELKEVSNKNTHKIVKEARVIKKYIKHV